VHCNTQPENEAGSFYNSFSKPYDPLPKSASQRGVVTPASPITHEQQNFSQIMAIILLEHPIKRGKWRT